jgi:hypothetical protein
MTFARTVLAAVASLVAFSSAASAAPTIAGGFYQEQMLKTCNNTTSCELMFTAVPAGKTLIVSDVACVITTANTASISALSLSARQANNTLVSRSSYPQPVLVANLNGTKRYQAQTPVTFITLAGEKPRVFASVSQASAEFVAMCNVSGELK